MTIDREGTRQLGCVLNKVRALMEAKVKGSVTIHLDGSGNIGQQIETHLYEWRDKFSSEKMGYPISEEELYRILRNQNKEDL